MACSLCLSTTVQPLLMQTLWACALSCSLHPGDTTAMQGVFSIIFEQAALPPSFPLSFTSFPSFLPLYLFSSLPSLFLSLPSFLPTFSFLLLSLSAWFPFHLSFSLLPKCFTPSVFFIPSLTSCKTFSWCGLEAVCMHVHPHLSVLPSVASTL